MNTYTVRVKLQYDFSPYRKWVVEREQFAEDEVSAVALAVAQMTQGDLRYIEGATVTVGSPDE